MFSSPKKEEKPLTYWEKLKVEKEIEAKKKFNALMSRRMSEQTSGSGYEEGTTKFAGASVQSRSRVGSVKDNYGADKPNRGFAALSGKKIGFAGGFKKDKENLGLSGSKGISSGPKRPLGF